MPSSQVPDDYIPPRRHDPARQRIIVLGIVLVVLIISFSLSKSIARWGENFVHGETYAAMADRYTQFQIALSLEDWQAAYRMMVPEYRFYHTVEDFQETYAFLGTPDYVLPEDASFAVSRENGGIIIPERGFGLPEVHLLFRFDEQRTTWLIRGLASEEERTRFQREAIEGLIPPPVDEEMDET